MRWDDVNARAAGLVTHLLARPALVRLLDAGGWLAAVRGAVDAGFPAEPAGLGSPAEFDRAVGRVVARRLGILWRWLGARAAVLTVVTEEEDRRDLRALLRAMVPTPTLPERALERLAAAGSTGELIRGLLRLGHPAGRALAAAAAVAEREEGSPAGLFGLELALARSFATRSARAGRRGGRAVRRFVASAIDRENAWSLLQLEAWGPDLGADLVFLPGGRAISAEEFRALARLGAGERIRDRLGALFAGGPLAGAFADRTAPLATLEARALAARTRWYRALGRREPLGPGRLFAAIERIRGEAHDLRLIVTGLVLGAAAESIEPLLVTAP